MKNKQTNDDRLKMENDALHKTFYATHTAALYAPKGFLNVKPFRATKTESNGFLARGWNCTERHVSRVRNGRGTPTCNTDCNCPNAQKAAIRAAADAAAATVAAT